jgi:hypothetical protein
LSFTDDSAAPIHVVFNFNTPDPGDIVAAISEKPGTTVNDDPQTKALKTAFDTMGPSLAGWFADKDNINNIKLSLAAVHNAPVPGAQYLTPQTIAFTTYAKDDTACLSVYIQTKGSGNPVGLSDRSFVLSGWTGPGNADWEPTTNSFPIPQGYSSSIIINRSVFLRNFLLNALNSATTTDGLTAFSSASISEDTSTKPPSGTIIITGYLNQNIVPTFKVSALYSDLMWDDSTWDFGSCPFVLYVDDLLRGTWSFNFQHTIKWGYEPLGLLFPTTATFNLKLSKSGSVVKSASDHGISVNIAIQSSDYEHSFDGTPRPDNALKTDFDRIVFPAMNETLNLDYFTTTNIFAPGKTMMKINNPEDVTFPWDLLILGNIVDPPATEVVVQPAAATINKKSIAVLKTNATIPKTIVAASGTDNNIRKIPVRVTPKSAVEQVKTARLLAAPKLKSTQDLINDMMKGSPTYTVLLDTIQTGTIEDFEVAVAKAGYQLDPAVIRKWLFTGPPTLRDSLTAWDAHLASLLADETTPTAPSNHVLLKSAAESNHILLQGRRTATATKARALNSDPATFDIRTVAALYRFDTPYPDDLASTAKPGLSIGFFIDPSSGK